MDPRESLHDPPASEAPRPSTESSINKPVANQTSNEYSHQSIGASAPIVDVTLASTSPHHDRGRPSLSTDIELREKRGPPTHIDLTDLEEGDLVNARTQEGVTPIGGKELSPPSPSQRIPGTPASEELPMDLGIGETTDMTPPSVAPKAERDDTESEDRHVAFLPSQAKSNRTSYIPHSSYPLGDPPINSAFGTPPMGQIGVHYPREMIRVERDYSGGELVQFFPTYPIELEGRITETQWLDTINGMNEILISAHSLRHAALHHVLAVVTLYVSMVLVDSHYEKEMRRLKQYIDACNEKVYNPQGLNILWPRSVGFLFLEIEYY